MTIIPISRTLGSGSIAHDSCDLIFSLDHRHRKKSRINIIQQPVTMGDKETVKEGGKVELKRELGLFSAVNFILAVMIGSGIFVSPTNALKNTGSVGFCLVVWATCGVLSLLGALAFAELSTVVPRSGAEYAYFIEAFGPLHRYLGRLPAFICSWIYVILLRPAEVAVLTLTFSEYSIKLLDSIVQDITPQALVALKKLTAILALGLITYINCTSVKLYVKVQNVFAICKIASCLLIIAGGTWWLVSGHTELLSEPFEGSKIAPGSIALAFYSGLWSYDGWTSAALITEEIKKPEVNILRSIIIAIPIMTVIYVTMNLMYMSVLNIDEMVKADAVAVVWAAKIFPPWLTFLIPLGVAVATFGCALSLQFGVSRLCYVAGKEGHVPRVFSFVHFKKMTPSGAVIFQALLSLVYIVSGDIEKLINFSSFLTWLFYSMTMVALLILRRTKPDANRPYRVFIGIPWLVFFIAVFLTIVPLIYEFDVFYFVGLAFTGLGCIVYHFYVYQSRPNCWIAEKFTWAIQVLCLVVAPDNDDQD